MKYLWIIFIPCFCLAQIQEKVVKDFSGGLVQGLSATTMADNQALELINYDVSIDENNNFGELKRRRGMSVFWPDAYFGEPIEGLVPWYSGAELKKLIVRRAISSAYTDDTASAFVDHFTICDETIPACSAIGFSPLYQERRNHNTFNQDYSSLYGRTYIASTKSEMVYYRPGGISPVRPLTAGQIEAVALDGGGNVNGRYTYKYCFMDTTATSANDTSMLSAASWSIDVNYGKVFLIMEAAPDTSKADSVIILRRADTSSSDYYEVVDVIVGGPVTQYFYIDTMTPGTATDTTPYWCGFSQEGAWHYNDYAYFLDTLLAPGGFNLDSNSNSWANSILQNNGGDSIGYIAVWYMLIFLDSIGIGSYPTALSGVVVCDDTDCDTNFSVRLTSMPVSDDPSVLNKLLVRRIDMQFYCTPSATPIECPSGDYPESLYIDWHIVDTLRNIDTTYEDVIGIEEAHWFVEGSDVEPKQPRDIYVDDSALSFQPTSIAEHGTRMYAVGDRANPDYLWYSSFGEPREWPPDLFLALPSKQSDWFNGLLSITNNDLLAFRQNSVMQISGLTFYQYSVDEILTEVGLTAPRTLLKNQRGVYFVHQTGLWKLGMTDPLSVPIGNLVDSVGGRLNQSVAQTVNGEYWWSVPLDDTSNSHTLIWVESPKPHWKKYDFGFNDAVYFNPDTLSWDFTVTDLIIARDNDTLYQIDFTSRDTLDGVDTIYAVFQSKYFFAENNDREQIHWIDLDGTGTTDSLRIIFYRNYGENKPGVPFDTVVFSPDFSDHIQDRVQVGAICHNFSLRIEDFGMGNYSLKGYTIGWQPWDRGNE